MLEVMLLTCAAVKVAPAPMMRRPLPLEKLLASESAIVFCPEAPVPVVVAVEPAAPKS